MTLWFNKKNNKIKRTKDEAHFMPMNPGMACVGFELEIDYNIKVNFDIVIDYRGLRHEIHCGRFSDREWDYDFFRQ